MARRRADWEKLSATISLPLYKLSSLLLDLHRAGIGVVNQFHAAGRVRDFGNDFGLDQLIQIFGVTAVLDAEGLNSLVQGNRVNSFYRPLLGIDAGPQVIGGGV